MWFGGNQSNQQQQSMPLGSQTYGQHPQFNQYQQPQNQGFMGSMMGGATNGQYNPNQPMTPPSELEIVSALLHHQKPMEQFLAGQNLATLTNIIANIVNLSLVEFFRNAKFTEDKDGNLCVDITTLPSNLQTLSPENVQADMTTLQANCNQAVQQSLMQQQQLLQMAQQNMMQGMLDSALQDPGMLTSAGQATGGFIRSVLTGR